MMTEADAATWPAVRDAMRVTTLSQARISQLIHSGRLRAVRTRLGWLINPTSLAALQAERAARKARGKR
jgi:hypothetical protein